MDFLTETFLWYKLRVSINGRIRQEILVELEIEIFFGLLPKAELRRATRVCSKYGNYTTLPDALDSAELPLTAKVALLFQL